MEDISPRDDEKAKELALLKGREEERKRQDEQERIRQKKKGSLILKKACVASEKCTHGYYSFFYET